MPLDQLTEFWQVWDCLRDCGWTQVRVGGDPRFVRPGCASGYGQEGFEWFGDSEDVQDHVRTTVSTGGSGRAPSSGGSSGTRCGTRAGRGIGAASYWRRAGA